MTTQPATELSHLVVIGASAGGVHALSVLVASLPPDFPAPVVVAQHLDPNRPSHLGAILERSGPLPVVIVGEDTALERGKIYVVPSNRHVVIRDGKVALESDHANRPRPSVDLLLSTAAKEYGDRLIAVILTGSGSDGASGAVDVKEQGGTVIIQNPRTAAHPSMPMALPPTVVDHVADLEEIGKLLGDVLAGQELPERVEPTGHDVLAEILSRISRESSVDFAQYKTTSILRRIGRRMGILHLSTLEQYRDQLDAHPGEAAELVHSLFIQVTQFFRDREAFDLLEREVLPALIERGRERGNTLRLWSAGCATGEEAYSLALLIAKMLGGELSQWSVRIFATDVDEQAIQFARQGCYPIGLLRNVPAEILREHLEPVDHGYRIHKSLRQLVIFGQQDLSRGAPFPRIDLVVCRNLLIYFKPELQQEVLDVFAYSLHQTNGYLVLGKAETARPSKSVFEIVHKKWKIYRCLKGPLLGTLQTPVTGLLRGTPRPTLVSTLESESPAEDGRPEPAELLDLKRANEVLLRTLPVGLAIIDRVYRVHILNASARRALGIRDNVIDQDFLHAAHGLPYRDVRAAIDRSFSERTTVVLPDVELSGPGGGRHLSIQVTPVESARTELAAVSLLDITDQVVAQRRLEALETDQKALGEELGASNRRLTDMNKDLQDANEELQAANEELMLSQEELQATNEEFEATNEELQATNEELETNNEELQATNEELETTNDELQSRTTELQNMAQVVGAERRRLAEMVELAPFHILVLRGPGLVVESTSPQVEALFGGGHQNASVEELFGDPGLEILRSGVRKAFAEKQAWRSPPIRLGGGENTFAFTAVPTRGAGGIVDGAIVYAEDVTERRHELEREGSRSST